jgi:diaminopimelate decarboxylase
MQVNAPLSQVAWLDQFAPAFAQASTRLDDDPSGWACLWADRRLRAIAMVGVPDDVNPYPFSGAGFDTDVCAYPLHLAIVERLARGGASGLMALPSASLSTSAVVKLGTPDQKARFFDHYTRGAPAWSFFAVTESHVGSDASQINATLTPTENGWLLNGVKTLVGGVTVAKSGLVLARRTDTGAPALAIVCEGSGTAQFTAKRLSMHGLRGAGISELTFTDFALPVDGILGVDQRLPAMMVLSGVFERHRPMVAAMALGTLAGMIERLPAKSTHEYALLHTVMLDRLMQVADAIAAGKGNAGQISMLKLQAVQTLDDLRKRLPDLAGSALFTDPILRRLYRDAGAFEYMEGASNIHKMNAARLFAETMKKDARQ